MRDRFLSAHGPSKIAQVGVDPVWRDLRLRLGAAALQGWVDVCWNVMSPCVLRGCVARETKRIAAPLKRRPDTKGRSGTFGAATSNTGAGAFLLNRQGYVTLKSERPFLLQVWGVSAGGAFLSQVRGDGGRRGALLQALRGAADSRGGGYRRGIVGERAHRRFV